MKQYIQYMILIAVILLLSACKEDSIKVFGEDHYIHFTNTQKNTISFSFATNPKLKTTIIDIPIQVIGRKLAEDQEYLIEVIHEGENKTTLLDKDYELPQKMIFRKGMFEDTLKIKVFKSDDLKEDKILAIRLKSNSYFKLGPSNYQIAIIKVSNSLTKPNWWDDEVTKNFLGEYSDIKYEQFIIATDISDLSKVESSKISAYIATFVYYLRNLDNEGKSVYEADGVTKVLSSIPYAKRI